MKNIMGLLLAVMLCFSLVGCGDKTEEKIELTVSVAASLTDVMEEVKTQYELENTNVEITYIFGSSGMLQTQIEQGAEVDVFFSAGKKQMDALIEKELVNVETTTDLLQNKLVLIAPIEGGKDIKITQLGEEDITKIAIGNPESVPVGSYSKNVLDSLELWDAVQGKLNLATDVRQVLTWVEMGEVDCGFVYETDAKISPKVKIIDTAKEEHYKKIIYPVGIVAESANQEMSKEFIDFLSTPEMIEVFTDFGFTYNQ